MRPSSSSAQVSPLAVVPSQPGGTLVAHAATQADSCTPARAEFNDESCFSNSEIFHLLTMQEERNGGPTQDNPSVDLRASLNTMFSSAGPDATVLACSVYKKTMEYVKTFARFSGGDVIAEVRE